MDPVEDFNDVRKPLHWTEVGKMYQHPLTVGCILASHLLGDFRIAIVNVAVHRVVDHLDLVLHIEDSLSAFPQIVRNGSHTITLLDRIASDWKIRTIQSDQRDVGPVQCRDKWQAL